MTIYPAIELKGGPAVRLLQGRADQETLYATEPAQVAASFRGAGSRWMHAVDLDVALAGEPQKLRVEFGGLLTLVGGKRAGA